MRARIAAMKASMRASSAGFLPSSRRFAAIAQGPHHAIPSIGNEPQPRLQSFGFGRSEEPRPPPTYRLFKCRTLHLRHIAPLIGTRQRLQRRHFSFTRP